MGTHFQMTRRNAQKPFSGEWRSITSSGRTETGCGWISLCSSMIASTPSCCCRSGISSSDSSGAAVRLPVLTRPLWLAGGTSTAPRTLTQQPQVKQTRSKWVICSHWRKKTRSSNAIITVIAEVVAGTKNLQSRCRSPSQVAATEATPRNAVTNPTKYVACSPPGRGSPPEASVVRSFMAKWNCEAKRPTRTGEAKGFRTVPKAVA
mmetsp:Transcript_64365/g.182759  ORF Transcript_64365/g.182759 Transcript_64365/m.182759 type:complete len:206 (-) Transcript_64365:359-976(-)